MLKFKYLIIIFFGSSYFAWFVIFLLLLIVFFIGVSFFRMKLLFSRVIHLFFMGKFLPFSILKLVFLTCVSFSLEVLS